MIRYYYKTLRTKKLGELDSYKPGCWVYVESPTSDEVDFLVRQFKLEAGHVQDALDPDEMPRLEREGDMTYIFVRYAFTTDDLELDTAPLLCIVGPEIFITISTGEVPRLQRFLNGRLEFATTQRTRLSLMIMDQIADQYEVFINNVGRQIKIIRSRLKGHDISNQDFVDFVLIEDELNEFLSAMLPTTAILRRLLLGRHIPLFEQDQDVVEDLLLNTEQSIEGCRSHVKSITNIREAYATISSNNLNQTIKVLTVVTIMITLPNVLFGMYGMNVDLPFQNAPWVFMLIIVMAIGLCVGVYAFAKRQRII
jgi:magnesium transporter